MDTQGKNKDIKSGKKKCREESINQQRVYFSLLKETFQIHVDKSFG